MAGPGLEGRKKTREEADLGTCGVKKSRHIIHLTLSRDKLVHHASFNPFLSPSPRDHPPFGPRLCLTWPKLLGGSPSCQAQLLGRVTQDTVEVEGPKKARVGQGRGPHFRLGCAVSGVGAQGKSKSG